MIKNLTGGSVINYGSALPPASTAYDGTMFFKTSGTDAGLYMFGFVQDSNPTLPGDQSGQSWFQIKTAGLYVDIFGDTMKGNLLMANETLAINSNQFGTVNAAVPMSFINSADFVWKKRQIDGGAEVMKLTAAGVLQIGGNTVWHAGNDGQGSGLDADLLDGQNSTFFQNATNINTGTLNISRLPFMPIQQGGGTAQLPNKVNIGWGGTQLYLQVDSTDFAAEWPISIKGTAVNANYANSAGSATNANFATNAGTAANAPWAGISNRPTKLSQFSNDTGFVTVESNAYIGRTTDTWQTSIDNQNRIMFVANGATVFAAPAGTRQLSTNGQQAFTEPGIYTFVVPEGVTRIGAVLVGAGGGSTNASGGGGGGLRYINNAAVTAGETLTVEVGAPSGSNGGNSEIRRGTTVLVMAGGGAGGVGGRNGGQGTAIAGDIGGGNGGTGGTASASYIAGGGGAGGYSGVGGNGGSSAAAGTIGAGGGGGGSTSLPIAQAANQLGGGGVGLFGVVSNGAANGGGGSGGENGQLGGKGGKYGGGGSGGSQGGQGAVRIIWGSPRSWPSNNTLDAEPTFTSVPSVSFEFKAGNTTVATISGGGNFIATGDVTAFSDRRVKMNIEKIENALEKVDQLEGITYTRIDSGARGTGLIAQDVEKVLPEAVHKQEFDGMLSVAYGNIVGLLVEAIKELKLEVRMLKDEVESLKDHER